MKYVVLFLLGFTITGQASASFEKCSCNPLAGNFPGTILFGYENRVDINSGIKLRTFPFPQNATQTQALKTLERCNEVKEALRILKICPKEKAEN